MCGPLNNPADICSHGCPVTDLAPGSIWFQRPAFLWRGQDVWPAARIGPTVCSRGEEAAVLRVAVAATAKTEPVVNHSRFSSRLKLLRVTAWLCRFIHSSRDKTTANRRTGPLTA